MKKAFLIVPCFVLLLLCSCYYDKEELLYGSNCDTSNTKYSTTITGILNNYGCLGCHVGANPSGGIGLQNYAGVKAVVDNGRLYGSINHSTGEQKEILNNNTDNNQSEPDVRSEIVYDDFAKLDLRIATITAAEKVEKADKLLKLQVDLGFETRTIVSGIAQHFTPESLLNKQVIVVANLAPRKMRGIESQGMILTAEQPDGKLILVNPDAATVNGSTVR